MSATRWVLRLHALHRGLGIFGLMLVLGLHAASATLINYQASGTGTDGPLAAFAAFRTIDGAIELSLSNTLAVADFRSAGQTISDISFTLSDGPGAVTSASASGQLAQVDRTGHVVYTTGIPSRFLGIGGGSFTVVGNTITLEALGGGQPTQLITPFLADGDNFNTAPGIDAHNPYAIGAGSFTLGLSGVTSNTTVTAAIFSFGTGPETILLGQAAGGSGTQEIPIPEPDTLFLLGSALLGLALFGVARRSRTSRNKAAASVRPE